MKDILPNPEQLGNLLKWDLIDIYLLHHESKSYLSSLFNFLTQSVKITGIPWNQLPF